LREPGQNRDRYPWGWEFLGHVDSVSTRGRENASARGDGRFASPIASFSERLHGRRSHQQQELLQCAQAAPPAPSPMMRLPDEAQADVLRLLEASRSVVNQTLSILWPSLMTWSTHYRTRLKQSPTHGVARFRDRRGGAKVKSPLFPRPNAVAFLLGAHSLRWLHPPQNRAAPGKEPACDQKPSPPFIRAWKTMTLALSCCRT
jgi:hypothetical protein